jgi:hypothetical protein
MAQFSYDGPGGSIFVRNGKVVVSGHVLGPSDVNEFLGALKMARRAADLGLLVIANEERRKREKERDAEQEVSDGE